MPRDLRIQQQHMTDPGKSSLIRRAVRVVSHAKINTAIAIDAVIPERTSA
jgi:hypothetical protein